MKITFILLLAFLRDGVFGESVSVMEGDSVTLNTDVTDLQTDDVVVWKFGPQENEIAKLNKAVKDIISYNDVDERFTRRLQLNQQTGSLTIKNIRIKHSGVYLLKMITTKTSYKRFNVTVSGSPDVFETEEIKTMSEMAGNPVTLHTDVNKAHGDELILWRFGDKGALIAKYDMEDKNMPLQSPDERFRDRLQLNHQTGSLTITNTRTTDSGLYKVEIISSSREKSLKKFSVSVSAPPLSSGQVAAIVVGGLLLVAAVVFGVKYLLRDEVKTVMEGESAVLQIKTLIYWCCRVFHIDQWLRNNQLIYDDERLKGRLEMDQKTGSLTIKDTRTTDSGLYQAKITICGCIPFYKKFNVGVCGEEMKDVKEGESVTLVCNDHRIQTADEILWSAEPGDTIIAQYKKNPKEPLYTSDERFRGRLKLDHQTGSLTITESRITDSGLYKLKIRSSSGETSLRRFSVFVGGEMREMPVMMGDSVTLNPDDHNLQDGDKILWYSDVFGTICIAKVTRGDVNSRIYDDDNGRFKDRLNLDHQTGSLTITNIRITHTGEYRLLIFGKNSSCKRFRVTVRGEEMKDVMEGDSVTLVYKDPKIQTADEILWTAEPGDTIIAQYKRNTQEPLYTSDERFRDRLKLDHHTRSLTITESRITDSGLYTLKIKSGGGETSLKRFSVFVGGEMREMNVMMGDPVTLNPDDHNLQDGDKILWYFGRICIAKVTRGDVKSRIYDDDERFRHRLNLNHQTGSLTITNIRAKYSGDYRLLIISQNCSCKRFRVNVGGRVLVIEGGTVILHTGLTKVLKGDVMKWMFGDVPVANINGSRPSSDWVDGEFRDKLQVDPKTGSLIIKNINMKQSGEYTLNSNRRESERTFRVIVSLSVKKEESFTLETDLTDIQDCELMWFFEYICVAEISQSRPASDWVYEEYRDRCEVNRQTGSLTISNSRTRHSGEYKLKISSIKGNSVKMFNVTVSGYESPEPELEASPPAADSRNESTVIHMPEETPDGRNESDPLLNDNHEESSF